MCYLHPQTQQVAPLDSNDTCIQMSHWHHTMVDGIFESFNVCPAEKRTKHSSNILLRLVRFSAGQTLLATKITEKKLVTDNCFKI